MRRKSNRIAFTLIELLVVIAIISLLVAILFPVFARARVNARRASCLSNLKQMGLAVMQYTQDFDEVYPIVTGSGSTTWTFLVYRYIKNPQVYVIDDKGELIDYAPLEGARSIEAKVMLPGSEVVDLLTGKSVPVDARGNIELEMEPGDGKILFLAPAQSGEAQKLIREYELSPQKG